MSFTEEEKAYLHSQRLARLATVSGEGQPDVVPVGFEFDGDRFFISGYDLTSTRKYRNVDAGNHLVALVVDDLVTTTPWAPRFVRVYGRANVVQRDGESGEVLEITPTVSWSWNLEGQEFSAGKNFGPRRTVHDLETQPVSPATGGRPRVGEVQAEAQQVADSFAAGLQDGHDRRDADILNRQFAADVIWGSPFGALVDGYGQLHPIHVRFQESATGNPAFRYEVRHVLALGADVIVAHIARIALDDDGMARPPSADPDLPFSEMAMYVLVRHDDGWWLAAGQNTPMRPGGAVSATASFRPNSDGR